MAPQFSTYYLFVLALSMATLTTQACQQNVLLDDFSAHRMAFVDGMDRPVSMLGGDYGGYGVDLDFYYAQPSANPARLMVLPRTIGNHFFFKTNKEACDDISQFTAVKMVFTAPPGADAKFSLTQKSKDCKTRPGESLSDSNYKSISEYVNMADINVKELVLPLKHFSGRSRPDVMPEPFDFHHLKDFTLVDMKPANSPWLFYRIELIGNCHVNGNNSSDHHHGHNGGQKGNHDGHHGNSQEAEIDTADQDHFANPTPTPDDHHNHDHHDHDHHSHEHSDHAAEPLATAPNTGFSVHDNANMFCLMSVVAVVSMVILL